MPLLTTFALRCRSLTIVFLALVAALHAHAESFEIADQQSQHLTGEQAQLLLGEAAEEQLRQIAECDRLWMINTRHISSDVGCANLESPALAVYSLARNGCLTSVSMEEYLAAIANSRETVIYVHGNRKEADEALRRGLDIYRYTHCLRRGGPVDWVIWSWPSAKEGFLIHDARLKADRTDAQGLYLAWLLRRQAETKTPTTLIGYSFGGRIVTGALHALAGGQLGGRSVPGPPLIGANIDAGLVAPAIGRNWMTSHGYHSLATQNLDQLLLLYNQKDAVLKRYWLIDRVRGEFAMGYSGPRAFAPRADGSKLIVRARDCSPIIGLQHAEIDYYTKSCRAGSEMANLIDDIEFTP